MNAGKDGAGKARPEMRSTGRSRWSAGAQAGARAVRASATLGDGWSGIVFDIQRASLHDGPGLRTTVFLKGCPLRCLWCHNPESQKRSPEVGKSGKVYGREMNVDEVMREVVADRAYYTASGGGMTISGGEPTVQFAFCRRLLEAARAEGIHTCLDTCGEMPGESLKALIPLVDLWHYDQKATGAEAHRRLTGVDGRRIMENLEILERAGARIRLRCPIVPGWNDTSEHLARLEELERSGRFEAVERLPYHDIGESKYADLGRPAPIGAPAGRTGSSGDTVRR